LLTLAFGCGATAVAGRVKRISSPSSGMCTFSMSPSASIRSRNSEREVGPMVDAALAARCALEDTPELYGEVTLATVGELVRWELAPCLPDFYRAFPHLRLRLLADNRVSSLAAGEADVALRLARPQRGELVARKVHAGCER
jgi:hypothetical protein